MEQLSVDMNQLSVGGGEAERNAVLLAQSVVATPLPGLPDEGFQESNEENVVGKIFIGGLSWQTTEESLRAYFEKFGEIADVALMKDKYSGQPRGFGFVKFQNPAVLDNFLGQEHSIDGRTVDVKPAVPKSEAPGPQKASRPPDDNKIFVGGLAPAVTLEDFQKYFEAFGVLTDVVVMFDRQTQRSRGFGFVTYELESVVETVLGMTHEILNKLVEVKKAEPKEANLKAAKAPVGGGGGGGISSSTAAGGFSTAAYGGVGIVGSGIGAYGGGGASGGGSGGGGGGGYGAGVSTRNSRVQQQQMYLPRGSANSPYAMYGGAAGGGYTTAAAAANAAAYYGYGGYSGYAAYGQAAYAQQATAAAQAYGAAYRGSSNAYTEALQAAAAHPPYPVAPQMYGSNSPTQVHSPTPGHTAQGGGVHTHAQARPTGGYGAQDYGSLAARSQQGNMDSRSGYTQPYR